MTMHVKCLQCGEWVDAVSTQRHKCITKQTDNFYKSLNDDEIPLMTILQRAHSVPLGSAIYETDAEYEKLKKIVIAAVRWTEGRMLNVK
jgi:hypothetical protein